ncbi:MAG: hypothetical protein ICV52_06960, partial [Microcoleus sp. C1-bin4]|nr:hypothetical protein [Microcoleus sp. C1-bin4]
MDGNKIDSSHRTFGRKNKMMTAETQTLWQQLNDVKKRATDLNLRFYQAAKKLQDSGTPLSESLVEE